VAGLAPWKVNVSSAYVVFLGCYAAMLIAASFVVFTETGQLWIVRTMELLGSGSGTRKLGFLSDFGYDHDQPGLTDSQRAKLAEAYIENAEKRTLLDARVSLWVLIGGCVACAFAAVVIVGLLPVYVVSGVWTYQTYDNAATVVVWGTVAGGLVMGAGLTEWLVRGTARINRTEGCVAARHLFAEAQEGGVSAELREQLVTGSYPRLARLLRDARR
jgi:hypothetical protein